MAKDKVDIYELDLHESLYLINSIWQNLEVTRVPGGFMYTTSKYIEDRPCITSVFVPFPTGRI